MNKHFRFIIPLILLIITSLACGSQTPRERPALYPSATSDATQTPIVLTSTPLPTYTPPPTQTPEIVPVIVTATPSSEFACVSADLALNLRTQPSMTEGTNGVPLPNGARVYLTGTVNGDWVFITFENRTGWIDSQYLTQCQ